MLYNKYVRLLYDSKIKAYKPYFFYEKCYNYYRNHKEIVKIKAKKYQKELDLEIALKGLQEEVIGEKEIIVSDVDKDAVMPYKSGKENMFGYNTSVICENNNYILTVDTNESNVHDSVFL